MGRRETEREGGGGGSGGGTGVKGEPRDLVVCPAPGAGVLAEGGSHGLRGGGGNRRETGVKWETRDLRVCPAPRSGALAVGGYKRPRGREREACTRRPVLPARPTLRKRALDLPFIGLRRGSRCTMGDVAVC